MMATEIEVFFRGFHFDGGVLETEGRKDVVGCVFNDEDIACSLNYAGHHDISGDHGHLLIEERFVGHLFHGDVAHERHRPARVVVGERICDGIVLQAEVHVDQRAVGLVGANDVVAGRDLQLAHVEILVGDLDLYALVAQVIDHVRRVRRDAAAEPGITQAIYRAVLSFLDGRACSSASSFRDTVPCPSRPCSAQEASRIPECWYCFADPT